MADKLDKKINFYLLKLDVRNFPSKMMAVSYN